MPRKINIILICLLQILFCNKLFAATQTLNPKPNQSAQLLQLGQEIEKLQQTISHDQKSQSQINHSLKNNSANSLKLKKQLVILKKQLFEKEHALTQLKQQQKLQQNKLVDAKYLLHQQIRSAYLLSLEKPQKNRLLTYFSYLDKAQEQSISQLSQAVAQLQSAQHQMINQKSTLQNTLLKQKKNQQQLTLAQENQQRELKQVAQQLKQKNERLNVLIANKKALEQLITKLQTAQKIKKKQPVMNLPGEPFAQLKGKLSWPVHGKLANHFGTPINGSEIKYTGVIIRAPVDTSVRAIAEGHVIFAGVLRGLGLLMIIDQGHGYLTLYGHNQSLYKKVGDIVRTGDLIAKTGKGEMGISGLYFEIRHDDEPLNPENWCRN